MKFAKVLKRIVLIKAFVSSFEKSRSRMTLNLDIKRS